MKNKTLWKRLAAVALAAVLAVPTALVPVKDADAKTVKNIILQEDFSGAEYDGGIVGWAGSTLTQENGVLRVTGNGNGGARWILPVEENATYEISYRVKVEKSSAYTFFQTWKSVDGKDVDGSWDEAIYGKTSETAATPEENENVYPEDGWKQVTVNYNIPSDRNYMQYVVYSNEAIDYDFVIDDVKVSKLSQVSGLIANGTFGSESADTTGWDVEDANPTTETTTSYKNVYDSKGFDDDSISFGDWAFNNVVEGVGVGGSKAQVTEEGHLKSVIYQSNGGIHTYTLEAGKTYRVTMDTYIDKGGSYWIFADGMGEKSWKNSEVYTNASYETKTFLVEPKVTKDWQQIGVQVTGDEGKVYMDNFKIDEVVEFPVYSDGVGTFGKDGYGVQITDAKATATVVAESGWYDFNVDVKGAEGTSVKVYADDAVVAEVEGTGDWQTVAGTFNAADGMKTFAVESKGKVVFDNVDVYAHQHNATLVAGKDATCTVDGTKAYYECEVCGKKYEDADCTKEANDLTIPAAHKISYVKKVAATCTKAGHDAYYTCDVCKKVFADAEGTKEAEIKVLPQHKATEVKAVASTYTKTGVAKHYKCSCGKLYTDKACTKLTTKAKLTTPVKKLTVAKTSVKSVTAKSKALAVKWTKKSGVTGYEVQVALKKNFKSGLKKATVKGASKTTVTVKKLKAKKTYYVRVRAYKIVEGKTFYSSWSNVKSKKTK